MLDLIFLVCNLVSILNTKVRRRIYKILIIYKKNAIHNYYLKMLSCIEIYEMQMLLTVGLK